MTPWKNLPCGEFLLWSCSTLQHCDPGVFRSHHHHQPHHHHLFWPHRGWWHFIMTIFHRVYNFAVLFKGRGPFRHAHLWTLIVVECNMEYVCTMHTCEFVDIRCKILICKLKRCCGIEINALYNTVLQNWLKIVSKRL